MGDERGQNAINLGSPQEPPEPPWEYLDPPDARNGDRHAPGTPRHTSAGASWQPVDLGPYLRGEVVRPEPSVGVARQQDGLHLLYPGKEHACIGEMEAGKSWLAVACVAAELAKGRRVVYVHFEEADPGDTVERLRALGVDDGAILDWLAFIGPNEPADPFALAALLDPAPTLVVLDGINEAMSMHRLNPREEDAVATFRARLVKPCTATGAAVLALDHVVKDREKRDRTPMGSVHKGNGLTGSLILLENVAPFGRGQRGVSHVYVTKDRPGHLRRHGRRGKTPGRTYMGTLVVDDTSVWVPDGVDLAFLPPPDEEQAGPRKTRDEQDDDAVYETIVEIAGTGVQPSLRTVRARTTGIGNARVDNALTRLVLDLRLTEHRGPNRSRLFSVPGTPAGDEGP